MKCHVIFLVFQRKAKATESFDFARPAEIKNLKDRLSQARAHLDMGKTSSSRYAASDADMRAIDSEVQAIKNARAAREQSLVGYSAILHKPTIYPTREAR